ncbi:MAG: MAPEG family protein [Pigmentiphaga sp.]|nr:MAPEG family protein [Pigmentiphaga sp.]
MTGIAIGMLVAALLPLVATIAAKAGGKGFDNDEPRAWLVRQEGWRARANAAQQNLFESLPFFFAAVLFALYRQADPGPLAVLMAAWVVARLVYIACYVAGRGTLRSLVWLAALLINIAILFSA